MRSTFVHMPPANPPRFTLGFDSDLWLELTTKAGLLLEREQADAVGISRGNLNRIRNGRAAPGPEFIAQVRQAFPGVDANQLFPVVVKVAA